MDFDFSPLDNLKARIAGKAAKDAAALERLNEARMRRQQVQQRYDGLALKDSAGAARLVAALDQAVAEEHSAQIEVNGAPNADDLQRELATVSAEVQGRYMEAARVHVQRLAENIVKAYRTGWGAKDRPVSLEAALREHEAFIVEAQRTCQRYGWGQPHPRYGFLSVGQQVLEAVERWVKEMWELGVLEKPAAVVAQEQYNAAEAKRHNDEHERRRAEHQRRMIAEGVYVVQQPMRPSEAGTAVTVWPGINVGEGGIVGLDVAPFTR